jgi:L-alanine-DL-glutamate epimerase-like enolase superfamily enzyme
VERFWVEVPYRDFIRRTTMGREFPHFQVLEICRVRLGNGAVGFGELLTYPGGRNPVRTRDEAIRRITGRNATAFLWDDSLDIGLQMALFDAVGRALEVPVHALLGRKVRDRAALAWWMTDLAPADWASECRLAVKQGYRNLKCKGRPWWDVFAQLDAIQAAVPKHFRIDLDYTFHLHNAERAIPLLKQLEAFPVIAMCEAPVRPTQVADGKRIRAEVRLPIAQHYGNAAVQLREDLCDGFVMNRGGVAAVLRQGAVCATFNKPFFLQVYGTGITAAFSLHLAAVLSHATWPAVTLHQLYAHELLTTPLCVTDGTAVIPDRPGLGIEVDEGQLQRFRLPKLPEQTPSSPARLLEIVWPNGARTYYSSRVQMETDGHAGNLPVGVRGVELRVLADDGTATWRERHAQALKAPVRQGRAGAKP